MRWGRKERGRILAGCEGGSGLSFCHGCGDGREGKRGGDIRDNLFFRWEKRVRNVEVETGKTVVPGWCYSDTCESYTLCYGASAYSVTEEQTPS
jgi:hypothetical protein